MHKQSMYYILKHKLAVPVNLLEWAKWFEKASRSKERFVAQDKLGSVFISTVFLGIDSSFGPHDRPLLFETMVFRDEESAECERYFSWQEAEAGHSKYVSKIRAEVAQGQVAQPKGPTK